MVAAGVEGGDLNTRYEIEPMGRIEKRMQISLITHAGYLAIIIAVQPCARDATDIRPRKNPSRCVPSSR